MNGALRFHRQQGLVLIIVLIVLVAMTLAGVALMRSVNTSTLVAGNLALRQAATQAGDIGTESAIAWLQSYSGTTTLDNSVPTNGYFVNLDNSPALNQTWDDYWTSVLDPTPVARPVRTAVNSGMVWTLPTDTGTSNGASTSAITGTGNTVSYIIQRLCSGTSPNVTCATSPAFNPAGGNGQGPQSGQYTASGQLYYRITSRVEGPRNTVSYIQTIVAM